MIDLKEIRELKTNRITLRDFRISDSENLFNNYGTDTEITKYMLWKNFKTVEEAENSINYYIECYKNNSNFRQYAIEENNTHDLIGQISFTINKRHESAEIAYLISREYQGQGYAKESINLLCDYLFNEIKCTRISAEVMVENISSIKVLEKCGFITEGIEVKKYKKKDGMFIDVVIMAKVTTNR